MSRKTLSKLMASLLGLLLVVSMFSGCKKEESLGEQHLIYNLGVECETLDPALNTAVDGGTVITNVFEGLTRLDIKNVPGPGVAKDWTISPDGKTYTFNLRDDAKWSDGKAVTASDFKYSWIRTLTPATKAEYNYQLFYIKNSVKFFKGEVKESEVGIEVVNEKQLKVTLENPTPYFLELCAFPTLMPVRKDVVEKDPTTWAAVNDPKTYIGNGPFKVTAWNHKESIILEKNTNYWNAKNIKLDKITMLLIEEQASALAAFETEGEGSIDFIEAPPVAERPRLTTEGKMKLMPYLGTAFTVFNTKKAPFDNPKVRQAFSMAIDRKVISDLLKTNQKLAAGIVPYGMYDADGKTEFRAKQDQYFDPRGNAAEAKKLLAEAGFPEGKGLPQITYKYNTNDNNKKIAEALQDMWKKNLGIEVKLENLDWAVFIPARTDGDFQIARHTWIGDYMDPMTMLDMWVSTSDMNDADWVNTEFDQLIEKAKAEPDKTKRMNYLHDAEKILMADRPIDPLVYSANPVCIKEYVKDVNKNPLGMVYFDWAYIDHSIKDKK